jgi:xanthine dehydrogenase/oxidase
MNVYSDGSVTLSVSGIDVGQGLNTKAAQAAAYGLGIDLSLINVTCASTQQASVNVGSTGGSVTNGIVIL